jgi:hypothetical protein
MRLMRPTGIDLIAPPAIARETVDRWTPSALARSSMVLITTEILVFLMGICFYRKQPAGGR